MECQSIGSCGSDELARDFIEAVLGVAMSWVLEPIDQVEIREFQLRSRNRKAGMTCDNANCCRSTRFDGWCSLDLVATTGTE